MLFIVSLHCLTLFIVSGFSFFTGSYTVFSYYAVPDSKVHGANMGPIWGRQDPGGPHVGPMNFAIWDIFCLRMVQYGAIITW